MQPGGGGGVDGFQQMMQRVHAPGVGDFVILAADFFIPTHRAVIHRQGQGLQVHARAAHQDGRVDLLDDGPRSFRVLGHGKALRRFQEAVQVMGDKRLLLLRGLGGADVHALVNLHGIHAQNVPTQPLPRQQRQGGFPAGSRPDDADHALFHTPAPRFPACFMALRISHRANMAPQNSPAIRAQARPVSPNSRSSRNMKGM